MVTGGSEKRVLEEPFKNESTNHKNQISPANKPSKKKTMTIAELAGVEIVDAFWFPIDITYAPRKIPLDQIFVDLQNFQNRDDPYDDDSVNNIINAVLAWNFDVRILDRIILWRNSLEWRLYVLSWHSRLEAFRRLSTEYKDHEMVRYIEEKFGFKFSSIYALIMDDISFDEARFISLMSNALGSIEADTRRAEIYRTFREIWQTNKFIEEFGRKCEKDHRSKIEAYSLLSRNGLAIQSLKRFEKNLDDSNIIKRIVLWIGKIRKKYSQLSDLHENELSEWLLERWGYGNKNGQVNCQNKFFEIVGWQIARLEESGEFDADKRLNILKLKSLSLAMKEYYRLLNELREKKQGYYTEFHTVRRNKNKKIAEKTTGLENWIFALRQELLEEIKAPVDLLNDIEQTEFILFNLEAYIDDSAMDKVTDMVLKYIIKIEEDYYRLKNQKNHFIEATKKELTLAL